MDLIRREDAVQAVKAYLDLCCLTEAKFHKGLEDYNDEIAREIISNIVEPNSSEKPNNCDTCRNKGFEGCEQPCLGCGCCGLYEPKDEPQTERSK